MIIETGGEVRTHGEEFTMSEFWPKFWSQTFEATRSALQDVRSAKATST